MNVGSVSYNSTALRGSTKEEIVSEYVTRRKELQMDVLGHLLKKPEDPNRSVLDVSHSFRVNGYARIQSPKDAS